MKLKWQLTLITIAIGSLFYSSFFLAHAQEPYSASRPPAPTPPEGVNSPAAGGNVEIQSQNSGGSQQTTVIDANGNLKIVKPAQPAPPVNSDDETGANYRGSRREVPRTPPPNDSAGLQAPFPGSGPQPAGPGPQPPSGLGPQPEPGPAPQPAPGPGPQPAPGMVPQSAIPSGPPVPPSPPVGIPNQMPQGAMPENPMPQNRPQPMEALPSNQGTAPPTPNQSTLPTTIPNNY